MRYVLALGSPQSAQLRLPTRHDFCARHQLRRPGTSKTACGPWRVVPPFARSDFNVSLLSDVSYVMHFMRILAGLKEAPKAGSWKNAMTLRRRLSRSRCGRHNRTEAFTFDSRAAAALRTTRRTTERPASCSKSVARFMTISIARPRLWGLVLRDPGSVKRPLQWVRRSEERRTGYALIVEGLDVGQSCGYSPSWQEMRLPNDSRRRSITVVGERRTHCARH